VTTSKPGDDGPGNLTQPDRDKDMEAKSLNVLKRGKDWKNYIEGTLRSLSQASSQHASAIDSQVEEAELRRRQMEEADRRMAALERHVAALVDHGNELKIRQAYGFHWRLVQTLGSQLSTVLDRVGSEYKIVISHRSSELQLLFLAPADVVASRFHVARSHAAVTAVMTGELTSAFICTPTSTGQHEPRRLDELLSVIRENLSEAFSWAEMRCPPANVDTDDVAPHARHPDYFEKLGKIATDLERIDFHALEGGIAADGSPVLYPPFDEPETLPPLLPASPVQRSALFLHNSYYHFNHLAAGLRSRGWDALTVSLESPESVQQQFYHGEDLNLYDPDQQVMSAKTRDFFRTVPERYGALHFYGQGHPTFFPALNENTDDPRQVPWDFLELRRHRVAIGYMPSGCLDGSSQTSIRALTNVCRRCVWETRPDVCSDGRNLAWNRKLAQICDWVGLECDHATPERISPKTVYGPVVTALDPARWHPDLEIPDDMRIEREAGEILVYHAVGNYATRRAGDRDIKGTGAILAAIERLKAEGLPVRLIFAHDVLSTRIRYLQVQADIVVDQLNYGRYGANAREAMMLGRPTICHLTPGQAAPQSSLRPIEAAPMLDADEDTITDVLRALVLDRERRLELGRKAREFAVAWHGQDACAKRYEKLIDRIRAGLPPESPDLYPAG
jgi:hypothetical protein